jgi:hypothetical protein
MTSSTPRPVIISEFGPPALACIRSWGNNGLSVGMISIRRENGPVPASRYLTSYCTLPPTELFTPSGLQKVDAFLRGFNATGIIAINEKISCWLNDYRHLLNPSTCIFAPPNSVVELTLSKIEQLNVAKKIGFDALPTYLLDHTPESLSAIPQNHFPLCLRPDGPNAIHPSFKVLLIHTASELKHAMNNLIRIDRPILAQPFADLPNLVVHGARTIHGNTMGLQAFLVERKFQGVTLTIRPFTMDDSFRDKCLGFVNHFNITGNFHFEFLLDRKSGNTYFLEINCRLGGTTAKVYACGYDEPCLALAAYGIGHYNSSHLSNRIVSGKHALIKYCIYALTKRLTALDYPNESTYKRVLKCLYGLFAFKDEILSFSDIQGSLAFYRALGKKP